MSRTLKLPILVGPTGVGKSEVAFHLAKRLEAEILSADAFQVFKGLPVGTAQPSSEWQKEIKHHLVGIRDPKEKWNAVEFARQAKGILEKVEREGKRILVVGGAGFYIQALLTGPPEGNSPNPEVRAWVLEKTRKMGNEKAYFWLKEKDPEAAQRLHPNDIRRICRALEKSFEHVPQKPGYEPMGNAAVLFFGLERSRDKLDNLLRSRTETMWKTGLLNEAKKLMEMQLLTENPIWGAIGYQEAAAYSRGELSEAQALERIFRRTRQYAKRQWTWFKHQHKVRWINLDNYETIEEVVDLLEAEIKNQSAV